LLKVLQTLKDGSSKKKKEDINELLFLFAFKKGLIDIEFEDLNELFKYPDLIPKSFKKHINPESIWGSLKDAWIIHGSKLFAAKEAEENPLVGLFKNLYTQIEAVVGSLEAIKFGFAKHSLSLTFKGLNVFNGFLPPIELIAGYSNLIEHSQWTGSFTCEGEKYAGKHDAKFTIKYIDLMDIEIDGCDGGFNDTVGNAKVISPEEIQFTWTDVEFNKIVARLKRYEDEWKGSWKYEDPLEKNSGEIIVKRSSLDS